MNDIRARLLDFITNGTRLTTERYQDLATDAYNEIVALQSDVEMYKRMAIEAIDKAQNDAVAAARTAALGDAVRVCRDYHRRLLDLHKSHHHGYVVACNECANAILALKDERHE